MKKNEKRERILDAAQELISASGAPSISVQEIAQKAGIGKGSIYYYFSSKNEILEAVIERSYSRVLDKGQALAASQEINVFQKMEIIYQACLDSSFELKRQEIIGTFNEQQQVALLHQKFARVIITRLEPILADIFRQGIREGKIQCEYPQETARIVLTVLTVTLDNHLAPVSHEQIREILAAFTRMQEKSMELPENVLDFLTREAPDRRSGREEEKGREEETGRRYGKDEE